MYTIRATTDYAFDVTAQTEDFGMAEAIYRGLILTNCYAQVELEGKDHTVLRATYPLDDAMAQRERLAKQYLAQQRTGIKPPAGQRWQDALAQLSRQTGRRASDVYNEMMGDVRAMEREALGAQLAAINEARR